MASAGATAEVAALYITERHGDGPRRVLRLVPAWQTSDLFGAGDLGFPDDPSGSSAEVRLLAFRDGMLAASIDLYDSATEGQEDLSASNRLEIFMWPEHACLKVFEGMPNRWVSTSSYLMMSLADCTESRSSKDIYTPGTGKIISGHYQDGHPCRFVGHYDHHTHLSFSPIQMELGNHIIKSADLIGFGSGGRVSGCTLFHQYQGALKCCFIHRPKNEPLEVEILSMFYHPNIVRFYYAGLDQEDDVFICTELCVRTFEEFINEISEDKIASIAKHFKEIISGLAEVHRHGVVHRDVKPQNILLDDNNCIRIIDFGNICFPLVAAYMPSGGGFLAPAFCGTELYMSPELKRERIHNEKTDVFSLGIVYFTSFGRSVQDVRQLLCKVHFSATWNRQDDYESWKTYKFAQGWQGSVPLLKRMLMTMPGGRASMNELFELLSKSSS